MRDDDKERAISVARNGKCERDCANCSGSIYVCRITSSTHDFGWFAYCETAIVEDISRGLTLYADTELDGHSIQPVAYERAE